MKTDSPDAPRERQQFSKLVSKWENDTALGHNGKTDAFAAWLIPEAIACIREQQAALVAVRAIITEGAATGFNCKDGDWAERLFASQATSHAVLAKWRIE